MRIEFSPLAQQELLEALEYVARDNPEASKQVETRILKHITLLASQVAHGRPVTLKSGRTVSSWSVPPYRIYYRIREDTLEVIRVHHQARRPIERGD